jgi:hypothetical protein
MDQNTSLKEPKFSLTDSARKHLLSTLPAFTSAVERRGLVTGLTYSGGMALDEGAKILWEYRGPNLLIGGLKQGELGAGNFYDLLGYKVWIREFEEALLEGMTLTTIMYGDPKPMELLVIENAPENLLERCMPGCACGSTLGAAGGEAVSSER